MTNLFGKPHRWLGVGVLLWAAACAVVPQAEIDAMQAKFRAQQARIVDLAEMSRLAYDCPKVKAAGGVRLECFSLGDGLPGEQAMYLVRTDEKAREQVIAIRGTQSIRDWLTDAMTEKPEDRELGVPVHIGFGSVARAVYRDVRDQRRLKPGYKLFLTGHSLGGAAALLLGAYLHVRENRLVDGVYTFGQPKVFDNQGVTAWPLYASRVVRVVDCDDLVPIVPTSDKRLNTFFKVTFMSSDRLDAYQHMGESVFLMDNANYWMPGGVAFETDLTRNILDWFFKVATREPIDHLMTQYAKRLKAAAGATGAPLYPPPGSPCGPADAAKVAMR